MHIWIFGADWHQVTAKTLTHVISIAQHEAKSEKLVVFKHIQNQVHKVVVDIIQVEDKQILLLLEVVSTFAWKQ